MKKILFLLIIMSSCHHVYAQTPGLDVLGLAKQDTRMIAREWRSGYALGFLMGTFGDAISPAREILKTGKVPAFRAHLINGTCWRNRNCERGEPRPDDLRSLADRARKIEALAKEFFYVRCYISPVLEHDVKDRNLVQQWVDTIRKEAPSCEVVLSAFSGVTIPNVLLERHGNEARGDITSNDGASLFDADSEKYRTSGRIITFGWIHRFNLRVTGEKTFTPPSKRTFKASAEDVRQAALLLQPAPAIPAAPRACRESRRVGEPDARTRALQQKNPKAKIPNPNAAELWKTNAEDYGNGDKRGNRPLLISRSKTSRVPLIRSDGRQIGCVKYYGSYSGSKGYNRHYVGDCSGQSPMKLLSDAGNEWLWVNDRGNCLLVNAVRRQGYFR